MRTRVAAELKQTGFSFETHSFRRFCNSLQAEQTNIFLSLPKLNQRVVLATYLVKLVSEFSFFDLMTDVLAVYRHFVVTKFI